MEMRQKSKAQMVIEYAVLITAVVAGILAMSVYVSRAKKGQMRRTAESMGQAYSLLHTKENKVTRSTFIDDDGSATSAGAAVVSTRGGGDTQTFSRSENMKHQANMVGGGTVDVTSSADGRAMFDGDVSLISGTLGDVATNFSVSIKGSSTESVTLNDTKQEVYE